MDKYFAFDSFEGWPKVVNAPEMPQYKPGGAKTDSDEFLNLLTNYGQSTKRVELVKGFYEDSLTANLANKFINENVKASLVTVDCNLYESYKSVFNWLDPFLRFGTVLYIDDWNTYSSHPNRGPKLAFNEYKKETNFQFEPFLPVGSCGYSFIVC